MQKLLSEQSIDELELDYPIIKEFFQNLNVSILKRNVPLIQALSEISLELTEDQGIEPYGIMEQLELFLADVNRGNEITETVKCICILGGINKAGVQENVQITIYPGEIVSIVGPTGSGKSRLLEDIECMACEDTPTKRRILVNGRPLEDEERFSLDGKFVAQLSQNMNFVMDLSVKEFLEMHAKSRFCKNTEEVINTCFQCANELAGEKFTIQTKITQLSGGQSRALMIADTAYMSTSPIILIDEIENAGIDRKQAIQLLAKSEKIVLMSTHDPLLALRADKRIVIKNGGIDKVIKTLKEEKDSLQKIDELDQILLAIRNDLRNGKKIIGLGGKNVGDI